MDTLSNLNDRIIMLEKESFGKVVLILAVQFAQNIMNQPTTDTNIKLKMKAVELLNNPESFSYRLALSVAALYPATYLPFLREAEVPSQKELNQLQETVIDAFDAIAGQGI